MSYTLNCKKPGKSKKKKCRLSEDHKAKISKGIKHKNVLKKQRAKDIEAIECVLTHLVTWDDREDMVEYWQRENYKTGENDGILHMVESCAYGMIKFEIYAEGLTLSEINNISKVFETDQLYFNGEMIVVAYPNVEKVRKLGTFGKL